MKFEFQRDRIDKACEVHLLVDALVTRVLNDQAVVASAYVGKDEIAIRAGENRSDRETAEMAKLHQDVFHSLIGLRHAQCAEDGDPARCRWGDRPLCGERQGRKKQNKESNSGTEEAHYRYPSED